MKTYPYLFMIILYDIDEEKIMIKLKEDEMKHSVSIEIKLNYILMYKDSYFFY